MSIRPLLITLITLAAGSLHAQSIDHLTTDRQVLQFVKKHWRQGEVLDYGPKEDSLAHYATADFDNNGHTDLLVNGRYQWKSNHRTMWSRFSVVLMAFGKDSILTIDLRHRPDRISSVQVLSNYDKPLLRINCLSYGLYDTGYRKFWRTDTLVYANGEFIEWARPFQGRIESVTYATGVGDMIEPFTRIILTDSTATMQRIAGPYRRDDSTPDTCMTFRTDPDTSLIAPVYSILRSINFPSLKPFYPCTVQHCYPTSLRIDYDGGKWNWILDGGSEGSRGLQQLYAAILDLESKAKWQAVDRTVYNKTYDWWFDLDDKQSAIDSLQSEASVLAFVGKLHSPYNNLSLHMPASPPQSRWRSEMRKEVSGFERADFDGDGRTDLLFNGYQLYPNMTPMPIAFVVLSSGTDSFKIKRLSHGSAGYFFDVHSCLSDGFTYLVARKPEMKISDTAVWYERPFQVDTLVFRDGDFLELTRHPKLRTFDSIYVHSVPGLFSFFSSLDFMITDDSVRMDLEEDDRDTSRLGWMSRAGGYTAVFDPETRRHFYSILYDVDFPSADSTYPVDWTDPGADAITIYYDGGKVKSIGASDDAGPYWMIALRELVMDLPHTLKWRRVSETPIKNRSY